VGENNIYAKVLVREPQSKRPLERHRNRWINIKMDLKIIGWQGVEWIHLAQNREY
jgi:hypothetical protein